MLVNRDDVNISEVEQGEVKQREVGYSMKFYCEEV